MAWCTVGNNPGAFFSRFGHPPITRVIEIVYGPVWLSSVSLLPLFFCLSDRHPDHRRRFLVAFLLTWMFNGLLLAGVFMSAGGSSSTGGSC